MDNDKIETLLLKLVEDMAIVKSKLDSLEEIKTEHKEISNKIEKLEMQNERHEKQLSTLEHRANETERFVREKISETNKTQKGVFISLGLAVFGAIVSFVMNLL